MSTTQIVLSLILQHSSCQVYPETAENEPLYEKTNNSTRHKTNQAVQPQKIAERLKFQGLYFQWRRTKALCDFIFCIGRLLFF